jgi:hypothetical protein
MYSGPGADSAVTATRARQPDHGRPPLGLNDPFIPLDSPSRLTIAGDGLHGALGFLRGVEWKRSGPRARKPRNSGYSPGNGWVRSREREAQSRVPAKESGGNVCRADPWTKRTAPRTGERGSWRQFGNSPAAAAARPPGRPPRPRAGEASAVDHPNPSTAGGVALHQDPLGPPLADSGEVGP